jgi:ADP-heptose:LPS heptosyltransferase
LADPAQVGEWRRRFDALGAGVKVGMSWRGGVDPINRARRSIPLSAWAPVLSVPGAHFVSLQYGDLGEEIEQVRTQTAVHIHTWRDANPLLDLDFFAAQIAALDLVISVDNTTVHMAGALGIPVWALLPWIPDWRWKMAGTNTLWYPSVQLFRQGEAGNWVTVVEQVRTLLAEYAATGLVNPEVIAR